MKVSLEIKWKKAIVAYFRILFQHFPGGIKENHKNFVRISVHRFENGAVILVIRNVSCGHLTTTLTT
jgi:hypothetical protein